MSGRLKNEVAVVTGGTSGIGLATARRLATEGAKVFATGRRSQELASAIAPTGRGAVAVQGDVSKLEDRDRLFSTVREQAGRLDILFANASVARQPGSLNRQYTLEESGMKSMKRFTHVAAVALMASGMVWAQSSTTPCKSTPDTKSGNSVTTTPSHRQPDVISTPETANLPTSRKDATSEKDIKKSKKNKKDNTNYVDWDAIGGAYAGRTR